MIATARAAAILLAKVVGVLLGSLLLLVSALGLHPLLAVLVLVGLAGLTLLSAVRLVGLRRHSMQRGEVDDFVISAWLSLASLAATRLGIVGVVGAWLVLGLMVAAGLFALAGDSIDDRGVAAVAFLLMLGCITLLPGAGSVLTWRWLRRRLGRAVDATGSQPR